MVCFLPAVTALKYDWVGDNWYVWDDRDMFLCDRPFLHCRRVLDGEIYNVKSLAVDPTKGALFFTAWDNGRAEVLKAELSGESLTVLATYKVMRPQAVTLDLPNERVYWVDSYMNYIEGVNYRGAERVTIKRPIYVSHADAVDN